MFAIPGPFYKDCIRCDVTLPSKQFSIRTDTGRFRSVCSPCRKKDLHKNYLENQEDRKEKANTYALNHYEQKILSSAKKTAKTKNLEFNLTLDDIVIPEFCPYLGTKITKTLGKGVIWTNASIDRIDSSKGYVRGNIEIISRKANSMKNMATEKELIIFSKNVLKRLGE